jgi:hypothetical protein
MMLRYNDGLYLVNSIKKTINPNNRYADRVTFKMDLIYSFKHRETFTHDNPWLWPSAEQPARDVESIFISQMKKLGM